MEITENEKYFIDLLFESGNKERMIEYIQSLLNVAYNKGRTDEFDEFCKIKGNSK